MRWLLKRWWFWGGTGFMLIAVCAGYLFIPVTSRITQADCDKLELGWTLEQVIEALGEKHLMLDLGRQVYFADDDNNIIITNFQETPGGSRLLRNCYFEPAQFSFFERTKRRFERRLRALWPSHARNQHTMTPPRKFAAWFKSRHCVPSPGGLPGKCRLPGNSKFSLKL